MQNRLGAKTLELLETEPIPWQLADYLMRESQLLFVDNHRTIHARTPIASGKASDRLMIRIGQGPIESNSEYGQLKHA